MIKDSLEIILLSFYPIPNSHDTTNSLITLVHTNKASCHVNWVDIVIERRNFLHALHIQTGGKQIKREREETVKNER